MGVCESWLIFVLVLARNSSTDCFLCTKKKIHKTSFPNVYNGFSTDITIHIGCIVFYLKLVLLVIM